MQIAQLGGHPLDRVGCDLRHIRSTGRWGFPNRWPAALRWRALIDAWRGMRAGIAPSSRTDRARHEAGGAADDVSPALRQTQKLAALGQMASGIAHDFNNSLQAAMLTLDVAEKRLAQQRLTECQRLLETASASLRRASASSTRLLAFASPRQDPPRPVDLNELLDGMQDLLRSALGRSVKLRLAPGEDLPRPVCDVHELENALLNLAINARDAMPDGGLLTIASHRATLASQVGDLDAGSYVVVEVADTGCGMQPDIARRACEPFFTTKPNGRGTGLGLAMVKSFVDKHRGRIDFESIPGQGTTVRLFLPALA